MLTDRSLFIELVHRTKSLLDSIADHARLSREKFIEKEFGESFFKNVAGDIEKIDLLLNGFLNYIKSTTPVIKKDTVNTLLDEVLKKHHPRLEERKIRIVKKCEKELPETIVPDEQMTFILDSVLHYAMASISSGGNIEFLTKSFAPLKAIGENLARNVEIMVAFTGYQKRSEQLTKESGLPLPHSEPGLNLLLRLVYAIVQENQGTMEYEADERKEKRLIFLKFPVERRKAVQYQPVDE